MTRIGYRTRHHVTLRVEAFEDRVVPDLKGAAALQTILGVAAQYATMTNPPPSPSLAAQGSFPALVQSAKALGAASLAFGVSLGSEFAHAQAALGNPAFRELEILDNAADYAALGARVGQHLRDAREQGLTLSNSAELLADAVEFTEKPALKFVTGLPGLYKDGATFVEALGRFGQAAAGFLSPQLLSTVKDTTSRAQNEVKGRTQIIYDENAPKVRDQFTKDVQKFETAQGQAGADLRRQSANPNLAPFVAPEADELRQSGQNVKALMAQFTQQSQAAFAAAKQILDTIGAQATSQTIVDYNEQVKSIDQVLAGLPPQLRQAVAAQVLQYKFQLADGALVQLSKVRDYIGGVETANITFLSRLNSITVPLQRQADRNDAQLAALTQSTGGGGTTGGQVPAGCQGNWVDDTSDALPGTPVRVHITVNASGGSLQLSSAQGTLSGNGTFTITSTTSAGFTATATGNFTSPGGQTVTKIKFQFGCRSDGTARLFGVTDENGQLLDNGNSIIGIDLVHGT